MTKNEDQVEAARLTSKPMPVESMFPDTRYYEIDSVKAGARYAVWITTPVGYDADPDRTFATVFMPDGNFAATLSIGLSGLSRGDLMDPYEPTIQVAVGYPPEDAGDALAVRARDLLPPNERLLPGTEETMELAVERGFLDRAGADRYWHNLQNPAGDRFLAFLTEELYPLVAQNYRIQTGTLGLFGHSYGGLFATYASLQKNSIFRNFGASSPGILVENSIIFELLEAAAAAGGFSPRNLRMVVGSREITDPGMYQPMVGGGTAEFIRKICATPIEGVTFSSRLLEHESHGTLTPPAAHDFLRTFYLRKD